MNFSPGNSKVEQLDIRLLRKCTELEPIYSNIGGLMENSSPKLGVKKHHERCAYIRCCYLADELNCYGYKYDCVLFQKSNGIDRSQVEFDRAVDKLIDRVRAKDQNLVK